MKQGKVNELYKGLKTLSGINMPIKTAWTVYATMKKLDPHIEFSMEQEKKLYEETGVQALDNGVLQFKDAESRDKFQQKMLEIVDRDVDVELDEISIPLADVDGAKITPEILSWLSPVVNFTE